MKEEELTYGTIVWCSEMNKYLKYIGLVNKKDYKFIDVDTGLYVVSFNEEQLKNLKIN